MRGPSGCWANRGFVPDSIRVTARSRTAALLGAVALVAGLLGASPAVRSEDGAAVARRVAETYAAATHGIVAFDVTTHTQLRAGPFRRDDLEDGAYVAVDGKPVRKRVIRYLDGRHAASSDDLQRLSAKPDPPLTRFGMRLPYLTEGVDAYAFDAPREGDGGTVIAFRATIRDEAHGDGTMTLDSQYRPVRVVFHPAKLPPKHEGTATVTEATVTVEFGIVATGRWEVTRLVHAFSGRYGPLGARADATTSYDAYRFFPTVELAHAAIERE